MFGNLLLEQRVVRDLEAPHDMRLLGSGSTREGRVLSRLSPGTPSSRYRSCQRQTVGFEIPIRRMISTVPAPSAVASTMPTRHESLRGVLRLFRALMIAMRQRQMLSRDAPSISALRL